MHVPELRDDHLEYLALFPLPNVVFFPLVQLPLHVFEPRYQQLVKDVMRQGRPLAIPLLKPGYESVKDGPPPIHDVAGVGWIIDHAPMSEGRSLIMLQGVARVRILEELETDTSYRVASAEVVEAEWPDNQRLVADPLGRIKDLLMGLMLTNPEVAEALRSLAETTDRPELLSDVIAAGVITDLPLRQAILAEPRIDRRLRMAADGLTTLMAGDDLVEA